MTTPNAKNPHEDEVDVPALNPTTAFEEALQGDAVVLEMLAADALHEVAQDLDNPDIDEQW